MKPPFRTITVGVTGRRHIAAYGLRAVEESTRAFFNLLAQIENAQFILETGLAIGADSIAARAALVAKERGARFVVRAVLPMPQTEYERDFDDGKTPNQDSELAAFRALLAACDEIIEQPIVAPNTDGGFSRAQQYAALGERLVQDSDLLLAYWSGDASTIKPGGTVDVVTRKLSAISALGRGHIFSIATPENLREKAPDGSKRYRPERIDAPGACALDCGEFARVDVALASLARALNVHL